MPLCWPAPPAWAGPPEPPSLNILLIYSYHKDMPWQGTFERGLRQGLKQAHRDFNLYAEFLDSGRFDEAAQRRALIEYMKTKYSATRLDLVVGESDPAVFFLKDHSDLLPGVDRVYVRTLEQNVVTPPEALGQSDLTIVTDFNGSIAEMLRLYQPRKLFVVGDTSDSSGQKRLDSFRDSLARLGQGVETEYLVNLPMPQLLAKVSSLPEHSAIYYLLLFSDGTGRRLVPYQGAQVIAERANAPLFSHWESLLGSGMVGGYLFAGDRVGRMAAQFILAKAQGKEISLPPQESCGSYYDWRQLRRWRLDQSLLPADAEIRYHQPILFEKYKWEIIVTFFLLVSFSLLSLLLLIVNRKRRWAMAALEEDRLLLEQRVAERTEDLDVARRWAEALAQVDTLTGLFNRRVFYEKGAEELERAKRYGESLSLLMLDIDLFKLVNDRYGHAAGDAVLVALGQLINNQKRDSDLAVRFGGEEFAILLPQTGREQARIFAERLRRTLAALVVPIEGMEITCTASIGVAEVTAQDEYLDMVLARADKALYAAKSAGRNQVRLS